MGKEDKLSIFISLVLRHNPGGHSIPVDVELSEQEPPELLSNIQHT